MRATQAAELDLEVALAGVDSLFDMIKIVSSKSYKYVLCRFRVYLLYCSL